MLLLLLFVAIVHLLENHERLLLFLGRLLLLWLLYALALVVVADGIIGGVDMLQVLLACRCYRVCVSFGTCGALGRLATLLIFGLSFRCCSFVWFNHDEVGRVTIALLLLRVLGNSS